MRDPHPVPLAPDEILQVLGAHGVRFVLIGGLAAVAHGAPVATFDLDITPERSADNLDRLAAALRDLDAQLRVPGDPDPVAIPIDARTFTQIQTLTLRTRAGDLDLAFLPDGTAGFDDLIIGALEMEAFGTRFLVASLDDVIRSKTAAGRPKDLAVLPLLRTTRQSQLDGG